MMIELYNGAVVYGYRPGMRPTDLVMVVLKDGTEIERTIGSIIAQVGLEDFGKLVKVK